MLVSTKDLSTTGMYVLRMYCTMHTHSFINHCLALFSLYVHLTSTIDLTSYARASVLAVTPNSTQAFFKMELFESCPNCLCADNIYISINVIMQSKLQHIWIMNPLLVLLWSFSPRTLNTAFILRSLLMILLKVMRSFYCNSHLVKIDMCVSINLMLMELLSLLF